MRSTLIALLLLGSASFGGPARADDDAADVSQIKDKLKLWTDGKKHYLAAVPFDINADFFYSDNGADFWLQRGISGGADGDKSWDRTFWEPRVVERYKAAVDWKEGKLQIQCDKRVTKLDEVPAAEAKALLAQAKFHQARWKYRAYALARDENGRYYYVDRAREPENSGNFRLYAGPKGQLKPLKMTNVVSDSEGDIFSTKTGKLRLILDKHESVWITGKKKQKLTIVPVEDNVVMIYSELGVYTGQPLGTPCDDL